jgi:hypothetical protein
VRFDCSSKGSREIFWRAATCQTVSAVLAPTGPALRVSLECILYFLGEEVAGAVEEKDEVENEDYRTWKKNARDSFVDIAHIAALLCNIL